MRHDNEIDTVDLLRWMREDRLRQAEEARAADRLGAWVLCAMGVGLLALAAWWGLVP